MLHSALVCLPSVWHGMQHSDDAAMSLKINEIPLGTSPDLSYRRCCTIFELYFVSLRIRKSDSEIVMVDLAFGDDFFEQNRSWDDFGTTISGI